MWTQCVVRLPGTGGRPGTMAAMPGESTPSPARGPLPVSPVWLVLTGIASVQIGAALAKNLFGVVDPTAMVWLRLTTAAVVLTVVVRPRLRGRSGTDWLVMLGYAITLAGMNWAIYHSFARIPLGVAVTIEFLGPLTIAVLGSRRLLDLLWVGLAGAGVVLLGLGPLLSRLVGVAAVPLDPVGIALAVLAACCWAGYIMLGGRLGHRWSGVSGLAMASVVGAVLMTAPALLPADRAWLDPYVIMIGVAVGLLSSVVPYSLELVALRRLRPSTFGILMSLEPAAAAIAGAVILREWLSPVQLVAMMLVVAASVGAARAARQREPSAAAHRDD